MFFVLKFIGNLTGVKTMSLSSYFAFSKKIQSISFKAVFIFSLIAAVGGTVHFLF